MDHLIRRFRRHLLKSLSYLREINKIILTLLFFSFMYKFVGFNRTGENALIQASITQLCTVMLIWKTLEKKKTTQNYNLQSKKKCASKLNHCLIFLNRVETYQVEGNEIRLGPIW